MSIFQVIQKINGFHVTDGSHIKVSFMKNLKPYKILSQKLACYLTKKRRLLLAVKKILVSYFMGSKHRPIYDLLEKLSCEYFT